MKLPTTPTDELGPRRRELFFRIIDNYSDLHAITWRLHFLNSHFPPHQLDVALGWLVSNNVTGRNFVSWFKVQCQNSDLEMQRKLLEVVSNSGLVPIVVGKNFRA